jgi:hypothetical protein
MLNPNTIYFKTEAGMQEVKARALGLRAELRRLLILIDGNSPLSRLAVFVRGSEIDYLIAELEMQGLITTGVGAPPATGETMVAPPARAAMASAQRLLATAPSEVPVTAESTSTPTTYANTEPTTAQLFAVRRTAVRTLHDLLGPDADVLAVKIERCKDAKELRVAITDIRQTLDRQRGTDTGQRFLDAVRSAAEDTR